MRHISHALALGYGADRPPARAANRAPAHRTGAERLIAAAPRAKKSPRERMLVRACPIRSDGVAPERRQSVLADLNGDEQARIAALHQQGGILARAVDRLLE